MSHHELSRLVAFYLPQFHPIPENDTWWGKGFTEWTNVTQARPLFRGHNQPHLPADLGFYDLRLPETRAAQADLARAYGIHGFCYYHYWFHGKRILERPVNEILSSGLPNFPFCLCWANETWSRNWDGSEREVLLEQKYSQADDRDHILWLLRAFLDPRYIRIDGRPMFLIYRAKRLPDPAATVALWRSEARKQAGLELFLCRVESFADERTDPRSLGFDAAVEFQPDWVNLSLRQMPGCAWLATHPEVLYRSIVQRHRIYSYPRVAAAMQRKPAPDYLRFPCVTPSWDNTARRKRGAIVLHGSTPALYQQWLEHAIRRVAKNHQEHQIVFLNAWNEWAEGAHLEPDQVFGRSYLEATLAAVNAATHEGGSNP